MNWTVQLTDDAEADLQAAHDYFEGQGTDLGRRFLANVRKSLNVLESMPTIFAQIVPGVRFRMVDRFQYVIYYVVIEDVVYVIGVIHAKRDPQIWKARAQDFHRSSE